MLPQISPFLAFLFGFNLLKLYMVTLSTIFVLCLLRGIVIMIVVLPQQSCSSFIDHLYHFYPQCIPYIRELGGIFQEYLSILPLEMWHELYCHNFETICYFWEWENFECLLIHMIVSCKTELFPKSFGSTLSSFHFKNSAKSFSTIASHTCMLLLSFGSYATFFFLPCRMSTMPKLFPPCEMTPYKGHKCHNWISTFSIRNKSVNSFNTHV